MKKKIEKNLIIGSVQFTKKYGFNKKKVPLNEIKKRRRDVGVSRQEVIQANLVKPFRGIHSA